MENQNELTEDQIIELVGKVESYRLASIITAIIIGGLCLIVGIMGIAINMLGATIVGFVGLAVSLIVSRVLWNEVKGLDWVLPKQDIKAKEGKSRLARDLEDLDLVLADEKKAKKDEGKKKKKDGLDFEDINFDDLDL
ncbi:MAG TPA: hypothetical protein G4O06_03655 [Dehalococcoidia bacterium]|nr:hypothetical protein [Dehalococcoidia bacterium]